MADRYDYVIIGSGIAGLYAAILAREHGSVLVLTKGSIDDCNTRWAQGGIAAPVGPGDSPEKHLRDTIEAGAGLVDEEAARVLTAEAADRIDDLVRLGVPFDTVHGEIALAREGAHSLPRVLHAGGDATGAHIELTLSSVARLEGITVLEYTIATEILVEGPGGDHEPRRGGSRTAPTASACDNHRRAAGVRALDTRTGQATEYACRNLILATGGAGQLYRVSTNPQVATGDGIALAYRAGAEITDMEFFQFHPTALRLTGVQPFLISEAVRGEGGILRDEGGERFMPACHPQAELAPRDIVARAILDRMQRTGADHVLLDVTHLDPHLVVARFPQIYRFCLDAGLDITQRPIPVSPAAHYTMGGVRTNTWGETTMRGLYACGECACTGVHGANRLASNSLLETVVFAKRVVRRTLVQTDARPGESPATTAPLAPDAIDLSEPAPGEAAPLTREALQDLTWRDVGIVRDAASLTRATATLGAWQTTLAQPHDRPSQELADLLLCARLVTEAALRREESRGAHYRTDFPEPREEWRRHLTFRRASIRPA
ncbi:MAG: L-aspartate oxidase [Dehalococcoidia bacterium]|nr:L-aspartate oxidase [Dehalococcoidia bacterium]